MKNVMLNVSRLLSVVFIAGLVFVSVSCSDDDGPISCLQKFSDYSTLMVDFDDANCEEAKKIKLEIIKVLRGSKSCDTFETLMDLYEVENMDALIDALEDELDDSIANKCDQA